MNHEPAFPTPSGWNHEGNWVQDSCESSGMTLRDYFAAKAMQALTQKGERHLATIAQDAYEMADAMMEARK